MALAQTLLTASKCLIKNSDYSLMAAFGATWAQLGSLAGDEFLRTGSGVI